MQNWSWLKKEVDRLIKKCIPKKARKRIKDWKSFRQGAIMGYKAGYAKRVYQDDYWEQYFEYCSRQGKFNGDFERGYHWGRKRGLRMRKGK